MSTENDTRGEFDGGFDDDTPDAGSWLDKERQGEDAAADLYAEKLRARLDDRDRENEELRAELAAVRERDRQAGGLALKGAGFAAKVAAGRELSGALRRWLAAKTLTDPLQVDETADVVAAILRRVVAGLRGAILRGAILTPEQLADTCGDADTRLPEGFETPDAWPCRWEHNPDAL